MTDRAKRSWTGALLFLLAAGLRVAYVASVAREPAVRIPILDALAYHEWALTIQGGDWLGDRIYYQDPFYPFFLAGLYGLFGAGGVGVLLAQALLDACSVLLLYATALRLFGYAPALAAGVLAAGYAPFLFYAALLLKAPLLLFLFQLSFYLLVRAVQSERSVAWLPAGIALGLGALTRGNALLFVPLLLLFLALRRELPVATRATQAAFVGLGIGLALLPIAVRNYAVGGELVILNSQGGQNFYIGNMRANDTGAYRAPPFLRADPRFEETDFAVEAERQTGRHLSPSEVSDYWWDRGLEEIGADPGHFLRHTATKLLVLVNHHEIGDNYSFDFVAEVGAPMLRWPLPSWGLLLPFALCGAFFARRERGAVLLLLFAAGYAASLVLFFNLSRLRLPLAPLVILFAGVGLVEIVRRVRAQDWRSAAPVLLVVGLAYPVVFADVVTDRQSIRYVNLGERHIAISFEHHRRAVELSERGDEAGAREEIARTQAKRDEAEAAFRAGLAEAPRDRRLHHSLRRLTLIRITDFQRLQRHDRVVALASQLTHDYPTFAPGHAWLGTGLARQGNDEAARAALERALELEPENQRARLELFALRRRSRAP